MVTSEHSEGIQFCYFEGMFMVYNTQKTQQYV